ncbi:DUF4062 domain-containing protein [Streptomyces prunicolor]|uniref:DUF4062 domain-containing protein n=1 Tax=Streptomyces prunicolor TaxID=67348 RepID=UPI0034188ED2
MRIFISSVLKGLEAERGAVYGLIKALGHDPVRFEDFTAQNVPSREACLAGLDSADVYLLILGPRYGHRFPDTGQSPTHEEWSAATAAGKVRIVYRKDGVQFEPEQHQLTQEISNYISGVFRGSFSSTEELMVKVAEKVRELQSESGPLEFQSLVDPVSVEWTVPESGSLSGAGHQSPVVEVHVVPIGHSGYPSRVMGQMRDALADRIRRTGMVDSGLALNPVSQNSCVEVSIPAPGRRWNEIRNGELSGIRLSNSGQVLVRSSLPADNMGSILDRAKLPGQLTQMIQLVGALNLIEVDRVAVGVSIPRLEGVAVAAFDENRSRTSSTIFMNANSPVRIEPDESISLAGLSAGAPEVAGHLARALMETVGKLR